MVSHLRNPWPSALRTTYHGSYGDLTRKGCNRPQCTIGRFARQKVQELSSQHGEDFGKRGGTIKELTIYEFVIIFLLFSFLART